MYIKAVKTDFKVQSINKLITKYVLCLIFTQNRQTAAQRFWQ